MKSLIVYDSIYGNTEKIARAIKDAITGNVKLINISEVNYPELKTFDFLIIGSPTQGGRPTPAIQNFLDKFQDNIINNIKVAIFDTRLPNKWVSIFGYAAGRIYQHLKKINMNIVLPPEGFFVKGKKGPLVDGEIERAANWVKDIIKKYEITK